MNPAKFLSLFSKQPWAITESAWRALLADLSGGAHPHARDMHRQAVEGDPVLAPLLAAVAGKPGVATAEKIGVLKLSGPIVKGFSDEDCYWYGFCNIDRIHAAAEIVLAEGYTHLILHLDSPGGMVCGVMEAASRLLELREAGVRVTAFTDTLACSAAYHLAAVCDEIYASPTASVGSIGVICLCIDDSKFWENVGVTPEYFVNKGSEAKLHGRSGLPFTDEIRAEFQALVDTLGAEFKAAVSAGRPGLKAADMNGQDWFAAHAPAGYVDFTMISVGGTERPIGTIDDLLAFLQIDSGL